MKISIAQIKPSPGNINRNIATHKNWIDRAVKQKADAIFFPELSITGYEPKLAKKLSSHQDDNRFDNFQIASNKHQITIGIGMPTRSNATTLISMIIFQPNQSRQTYSKQILHSDELPYFDHGEKEVCLNLDNEKLIPAICYESLIQEHAEKAHRNGGTIYLASVAKPRGGFEKARQHFPQIAKNLSMHVLMSNSFGPCDDFESVGQSSIWNTHGELIGQLNAIDEGLLILDTITNVVTKVTA